MNKLAIFAFTVIVLSLGEVSNSSANHMSDQSPQSKDLSFLQMNNTVGTGRIYWSNIPPQTWIFQRDGNHKLHYHWLSQKGAAGDIGGHHIQVGQNVQVGCKKYGHPIRQTQFTMPSYSIGLTCR